MIVNFLVANHIRTQPALLSKQACQTPHIGKYLDNRTGIEMNSNPPPGWKAHKAVSDANRISYNGLTPNNAARSSNQWQLWDRIFESMH
jgi:hypothetical protein